MRRRAEERRHQGQFEIFSLKIEPGLILPTVPDRSDGENDFAHLLHRLVPADAEATFVVAFHLRAEAENKSAFGKPRQVPTDMRENGRTACKRNGDARAQAQTGAMLRREHQRQERVVCGFKRPDPVKPCLIGEPRQRRHLAEVVNQQARVKFHHQPYRLIALERITTVDSAHTIVLFDVRKYLPHQHYLAEF